MRDEFISAINVNQREFGLSLPDATIARLADYFDLVQKSTPLLHLVAPCSPEEFATRHVLESLTMLEFLPTGARFADVGSGAGLPSIPCLIARDDLNAVLIESKEKKVLFLERASTNLLLSKRVEVIGRQFEEVELANIDHVVCRALDRFVVKLPRILKWVKRRRLLLFGGNSIGDKLESLGVPFSRKLMPLSDRRYLFASKSSSEI